MPVITPGVQEANAYENQFEQEVLPTVPLGEVPPLPRLIPAHSPAITPPPLSNLPRSSVAANSSVACEKVTMPQPGDAFFGFRLVEEIGHGTFARVFLARQEALAGRDVALKVTLRPTREPERLASLQHENIVPVYSVHTALPVQIICMPYLGRRTIADVIVSYRKSRVAPGHSTRKAMATKRGSSVAGSSPRTGFRYPLEASADKSGNEPTGSTHPLIGNVEAVLGLLRQLADGLAHAHERGVLHLDLKPANVLIADTGEPMLLDFNLSFAEFEEEREVIGGTIPYMAPEQLLDLETRGKGAVDARTDLYSLGIMMFELLAGKHPFPFSSKLATEYEGLIASRAKGAPSLRQFNPAATPAVEAIVRKLLAPNPCDRYRHAADLREDLDRQLADRPLQFASDRSAPERLGKWRRRNPKALAALALATVLAIAGGAAAYAFHEVEKRAVGQAEARAQNIRNGLDSVRINLALPNDPHARELGMKQAIALLSTFNLPGDPKWKSRPEYQRVPRVQRPALDAALGELLLLTAQARWEEGRLADQKGAARDAAQLNLLAAGCFGATPPPFLIRQKAELHAVLAGQPRSPSELPKPVGVSAQFLEATSLIAKSRFSSAQSMLEQVVKEAPNHGAANFFLAYCRQQLGQFSRAIERFEVARSLMPKDPHPAHYCGTAHGMANHDASGSEAAEECFTQAIALDPSRGESYRARAVARMELQKWEEAEEDLTAALERKCSPIQVLSLRAKVREHLDDAAGAAADRKELSSLKPIEELDFLTLGYSLRKSDPKEALANYIKAETKNPRSIAALRNQAFIHVVRLHDPQAAIKVLDRLIEMHPEYAPARASRAVLLARRGKYDEARRDAELCGKLSSEGFDIYRMACVYAISSKENKADRKRAFALLKKAFLSGYHNIKVYEKDPDLQPLRDLPEFPEFLKAIRELLL